MVLRIGKVPEAIGSGAYFYIVSVNWGSIPFAHSNMYKYRETLLFVLTFSFDGYNMDLYE